MFLLLSFSRHLECGRSHLLRLGGLQLCYHWVFHVCFYSTHNIQDILCLHAMGLSTNDLQTFISIWYRNNAEACNLAIWWQCSFYLTEQRRMFANSLHRIYDMHKNMALSIVEALRRIEDARSHLIVFLLTLQDKGAENRWNYFMRNVSISPDRHSCQVFTKYLHK